MKTFDGRGAFTIGQHRVVSTVEVVISANTSYSQTGGPLFAPSQNIQYFERKTLVRNAPHVEQVQRKRAILGPKKSRW